MDTPETVTLMEWCAGYGGIGLGLKRAIPNLRTIAYSEVEAFAVANLVAKMEAGLLDAAPVWPNLKTFPCEQFRGLVDILVAGYPCQPFSHAGKRGGTADPRHLWPFIQRAIAVIRPRFCFFENVEGHITLGFKDVCHDLDELGYETAAGLFSAAECGAPHQRKRVFILAHHHHQRLQGRDGEVMRECSEQRITGKSNTQMGNSRGNEQRGMSEPAMHGERESFRRPSSDKFCDTASPGLSNGRSTQVQGHQPEQEFERPNCWPSRPGERQYDWEPPRVVGDTTSKRLCGGGKNGIDKQSEMLGPGHENMGDSELGRRGRKESRSKGKKTPLSGRRTQREVESPLGGNPDGPSSGMDYAILSRTFDNRTDELRLIGNGVVPAVAEKAWRVLYQELMG